MIFLTVGSQMSFDRLVRAVDAWAGKNSEVDIFAQIGPTHFQPQHLSYARFIDPAEFQAYLDRAEAVISHAGMGTIISAVERGKPILVMPRRGEFNETRNDHQVSTAERFSALGLVNIAMDEAELWGKLDAIDTWRAASQTAARAEQKCPRLVEAVKAFVAHGALTLPVAPDADLAGGLETVQ